MYSLKFVDSEAVEDGGQRGQRVAQGQIDPGVVERRHQTSFLLGRHTPERYGLPRLGGVRALRDQVIAL